jgi:glutaconate CoA-transferase subunit B
MPFTPQELMVVAAAREIGDGQVVFTGMRLPLIAFALAKQTHATHAIGLFECGLARDTPAQELLYTMGDPPNIAGALWATRMVNIMGLLAQGAVDVGFIGGAEIDRFGNLNTSYVQDPPSLPSPEWGAPSLPPLTRGGRGGVKLPGSGGAADIASLSKRLVIIMAHEKRRLVERVSYITSPGYGDGSGWRQRAGLRRGGPSALITTRGIFRFDSEQCEAVLHSYHPGETVDSVRQDTGWELKVAPDVHETPAPTPEELEIIRRYDPQGFWTGRRRL